MKRGSFDARVAKCLAQFRQVETRSNERGERLGLDTRAPNDTAADAPPRRA
jgi:hypothetical protein